MQQWIYCKDTDDKVLPFGLTDIAGLNILLVMKHQDFLVAMALPLSTYTNKKHY